MTKLPHNSGAIAGAWVGQRLNRAEDPILVRGLGTFVADIAAKSDCMYAVFVRSPVASGAIKSIHAPANVKLFTNADLNAKPIEPRLLRPEYVPVAMPILAHDVVRFAGEPIAVVIAASVAEAEDAAERVEVEIEPLPAVLSVEDALAPQAPLVHPGPFPTQPNAAVDVRKSTPEFELAAASGAHRIEIQVSSGRQSAMPLEARASHVSLDAATGRVTLHTTTQMPHVVRTGICDTLGFSEDMLRVVAPDVGGGFGAKMSLAREDVALVAIARATRQDLAWIETREENFLGAWHSREQTYKLTGSFKPDGELVALEARIFADVGAYSCYPVTFGVEALMGLNELSGPYRFQHFSGHSQAVLTNKCPVAPYRGVSRPVFTMALERLMDEAADELDIDRLSIRLKNVVTEYPHHSPTGVVLDAASHAEAIELTRTLTSSDALAEEQRAARARGNLVGQGYAVFSESSGFGTSAFAARKMEITVGYERVNLALDPSGNALLRIGASPHGQGLQTSLAQLVADEIGVMPDHVRVIHSDTDATPYGWGTFASRSMVIAGGASKIAAEKVAKQIKEIAAGLHECSPDDVVLSRGDATVRGTQQSIPVSTIARHAYHSSHLLPAGFEQGIEASGSYDPDGTYSNSVHIADVEVDPRTGATRILRYVVVEDAGRLINPAIVDGQIRGGVAQGIGNALFEELLYDDIGNLTTTTLMDFLPPTIAEMPEVEIHHLETLSDSTITGAKGVGEGGTMGAPAAIVSAINDALRSSGARIDRVPATPQRIRHAIRSAHEQSA